MELFKNLLQAATIAVIIVFMASCGCFERDRIYDDRDSSFYLVNLTNDTVPIGTEITLDLVYHSNDFRGDYASDRIPYPELNTESLFSGNEIEVIKGEVVDGKVIALYNALANNYELEVRVILLRPGKYTIERDFRSEFVRNDDDCYSVSAMSYLNRSDIFYNEGPFSVFYALE